MGTNKKLKAATASVPDGAAVISKVIKACKKRPAADADPHVKTDYAVRFADAIAQLFAEDLHPRLPSINASTKRDAGAVSKKKQLDVNFSTPALGLALGISLKSVHTRDRAGGQRYTHNMKRNEEELRIEASGYHKRQPYAVMIGVLFLPFDSCTDGKGTNSSSFGSWVRHLRPYAGRIETDEDYDRFEKIYIALYDPKGEDMRFFDVEADPPKNRTPPKDGDLRAEDGRPKRLLSYAEFLDEAYAAYARRNPVGFRWADGEEEPLDLTETQFPEENDGE